MSWIVNTSTVTGQIKRPGDAPELRPAAGPVELRGLVDLARNVAQAGDEQKDVEADAATRS